MFYLIHVIYYFKYIVTLNVMVALYLIYAGQSLKRKGNLCNSQKDLIETFHT